EPALREVRLEQGERLGRRHVGHEPQVELRHRAVRQDGLAARAGVAADQTFDVDRGARHEALQRLDPAHVAHPVVHAHLPLRDRLVEAARRRRHHRLVTCRQRARFVGVAVDGRLVAVGRDQRRQRLDQMPRRAVHAGLVARVNVFLGPAPPPLPARDELALDHAFGAERDGHLAVGRLGRRGHEDPRDASQGGLDLRPAHDLREMGRADLLLTLGHEHEVERRLLAGGANGVQRGEEGRLRALLVHGAAADQHLAEPGTVDDGRRPGRRRPLGRVDLLDVVHEVQAERARGAGVERREDAGLAVGRDFRHLVEARVFEHAHGELAALVHAAVLGGDGRLSDPLLQACHGFVVALFDLREDRGEVVGARRRRHAGPGEGGGGARGALGAAGASGQERNITGGVTSATNGEAIAGVNVSVTGAAFAAVTNADGRYTISAPSGAVTLVFRRIAFKRREVSVPAGQNAVDAALEADVFNLEAVVVTGQATGVERRNAAIATTNVTGEEASRVPAPSLDRALAGRVPGAIINQNSGAPGGGTQIQIRGNNTVIGNPDPLFVVDGVLYSDASDRKSTRLNSSHL